jgi:hypothetical protein
MVKAWREKVTIPTYEVAIAFKNAIVSDTITAKTPSSMNVR